MDDLTAAISAVLNDPESMRQLQGLASGLGLGQAAASAQPPQPMQLMQPMQPPANANPQPDMNALAGMLSSLMNGNGGGQPALPPPHIPSPASSPARDSQPDLSALAGMLSGILGQSGQSGNNQSNGSQGPDISGLAGILGNALGNSGQTAAQKQNTGFDISALTNMLGGPGNQDNRQASPLGIDMNMIIKLQQAMSSMQANRQNIDFLLSLKPRLNSERSKKIDDAIKVMQVIQFLPLLKDSGIFSGLDSLLGGITGSGGGISNMLNMGSGGLGGIVGSLLGRR